VTDGSGNFSLTVEQATACNDLSGMTRLNYTCSVDTNGPVSLGGIVNNIAGSCVVGGTTESQCIVA